MLVNIFWHVSCNSESSFKHLSIIAEARIHHLSSIYLTTLMHLFIVQESQSNSKGNRETGMGKVV